MTKAFVCLSAVGSPGSQLVWEKLDSNGTTSFQKPPQGTELLFVVTHPDLGIKFVKTTATDVVPQVVELDLSGGVDVELETRDGSEAVSGVHIELWPHGADDVILDKNTNASGLSTWKRLQSGKYAARLSRPGYWTAQPEFTVTGGGLQTLQIRRRGNAKLSLRDSSGAPIAGSTFTLHSTEFDTTVAAWRAQGRLSAESVQLTTNSQGEATVIGIPNGEYSWSVTAPDGTPLSGVIQVPKGEWASATAQLTD